MLAAAACAWGARALFDPVVGLFAGGLLGASFLMSTEGFIAKTDAVLAGSVTLALAALARIYAESHDGPPAGRRTRLLFWLGLALSILVKGPIGPMVVGLTLLTLMVADRKAGWIGTLGWGWAPILLLTVVGPWAWAVTVATDGAFWSAAIAGDLAPKLAGNQETHGAPPGFHALLAPLLFFPGSLLIPALLVFAWRERAQPGVRFALAWLIPAWLVFEIAPTKLVHYTLPTYGALAILAAATLRGPIPAAARWVGAVLGAAVGLLLAAVAGYLVHRYGDPSDIPFAAVTAILLALSGVIGAVFMARGGAKIAIVWATALAIAGHGALVAGLAPRLAPLWVSQRAEGVLAKARLLPRQGVAPSPVAVAGYAEPSLVFGLGTATELGDATDAATALSEGRPALVEERQARAFRQAAAAQHLVLHPIGQIQGLDYSTGKRANLTAYAPQPNATPPTSPDAGP